MKTRRPSIPQRRAIFIGCEGESEQGYAGFLQDLTHEADLHVHLYIELLKAGDPLARIELAIGKLARLSRTRSQFTDKFLFLDTDQLQISVDRANRARQLASKNHINIIWQEPCFEAILLRHFEGRASHRPPTNQATRTAILQVWPQYQKPMTRADLAGKLDFEAVTRAAGVEAGLLNLLRCIGLQPPLVEQ